MTFENLILFILFFTGFLFIKKQIKKEINYHLLILKHNYIQIINNPDLSIHKHKLISNNIKEIDLILNK